MGRVGGKGKGQDDISLMRIPSLARFQSQDCDYRGGHAVYFHMRICGCGCDQARPQHVPSSILADFGPDIHVFRVKNRISHIFPFPGGSPGQSLFLRYEIEKRLRVRAVYFQTALPPGFVQLASRTTMPLTKLLGNTSSCLLVCIWSSILCYIVQSRLSSVNALNISKLDIFGCPEQLNR